MGFAAQQADPGRAKHRIVTIPDDRGPKYAKSHTSRSLGGGKMGLGENLTAIRDLLEFFLHAERLPYVNVLMSFK